MTHNHRFSRRGQGKTEYVIIVVLIAIAVLAAVFNYGAVLQEKFLGTENRVGKELKTEE